MTKKLEGKTDVITGGTERIGLTTAKLFVGGHSRLYRALRQASHNGEDLTVVRRAERESKTVDIDDRLGKSLRSLLRQVVANAALDIPVRIFARELIAIG